MRRLARFLGALGVVLVALAIGVPAGGQLPEGEGPGGQPDGQKVPRVLRTGVRGAITPVIADHLSDGVRRAVGGAFDAYLIELDTPGGLDTSTREIVQRLLGAEVPVIVHVTPPGARAASAGAFITLAAHVAAMSPGTAIGASTPVNLGEEGASDVDRKVVNDAAAFAEAIARARGRNVQFAIDTVRDGRSVSAGEALEIGAIDLIADSRRDLLDQADGRQAVVGGDRRQVTLRTAGAVVETQELGLFRRIQQVLANPNVAFLFLSIGTLAIIYELASPGVGAGGIAGAVFIILSLFAVAVLPVSAVGLLLIALAVALFVAELFVPGVGVFAFGGTVSLVLGGVFLFRDAPGIGVSLSVLLPVAVVVGPAVVLAGRVAYRSRMAPVSSTGAGALTGRAVTIARPHGAAGQARLDGAWWTVRSTGPVLVEGQAARVVDVDGIVLVVEPVPASSDAGAEEGSNDG